MREERLVVRPFEDFRVLDYSSIQQVNEHALAEIKGSIPYDRREDYINDGMRKMWVQVIAIVGETETVLFYGLVKKMQIKVEGGICIVSMSLCSGTQLMDYEEHIRSFQEGTFTYSHLLDICSCGYENSAKIITGEKGKTIRHFTMQYQETDWVFIKRLASQNNTVVFADCSTKGVKYHFGIPNRVTKENEVSSEYQTQLDMQEYWYKKSHDLTILSDDTISYIWESREIHKLGESSTVNNKEFVIWKISSCLKGNELCHTYFKKTRAGLSVPMHNNKHLAGVSLLGTVKRVENEKVQIVIAEDENKRSSGTCWYTFSTMYSSSDGTGWYCMPEVGDTIRLYFPSSKEESAYVASSFHEGGTNLRTHPECKFWRNKEGKEIQLSPEQILLTNNSGTFVRLSDEDGVEIVSEGSVTLHAKNTLMISSTGSSIEMSASKKIRLQQGDTEMNLGGDIHMRGAKIRL